MVQVRLEIVEKEIQIAPDAYVQALTFNGSVPSPLIVVHQDDYVEFTIANSPNNTMMHNIDLHASSGSLGAAGLSKVNPGQEATVRFKANRPGVFVYHCAPWRIDDSLSCHFGDEWGHYGASSGWFERRER